MSENIDILAIVLVVCGFLSFGAGFIIGTGNITKQIKQELCKEFTKTPYEYINCNTNETDEIIGIIRKNK